MVSKSREPAGMDPLAALIKKYMSLRGLTRVDLEDRGIKHATLHGYLNPKGSREQPIRKRQMRDLANALDVPLSEVERAAVESVGYLFMRDADQAAVDAVVEPRLRAEAESAKRASQVNPKRSD